MSRPGPFRGRSIVALAALAATIPLFYREEVLQAPLEPLISATAWVTHGLIQAVGIAAEREGAIFSSPGGFAYEIYYRCTGFLPVLCLAAAILASSAPMRRKLAGLAVGVPILLGLNLVRLVHLFHLGVARPEVFDFAHAVVWEAGIIVAVAGLFLAYLLWSFPPGAVTAGAGSQIAVKAVR